MKTVSIQVHPEDWKVFQEKCRLSYYNQSQMIRILAEESLRRKIKPRSKTKTPSYNLKHVSFTVPAPQERRWRRECGMSLRVWLCECVLPLAHVDWSNIEGAVDTPENVHESADGLRAVQMAYSERAGIRLLANKAQYAQFEKAADGQQLTVEQWAMEVLEKAAPWYIDNPKTEETK